jgi:Glycosyl hydrolase family 76
MSSEGTEPAVRRAAALRVFLAGLLGAAAFCSLALVPPVASAGARGPADAPHVALANAAKSSPHHAPRTPPRAKPKTKREAPLRGNPARAVVSYEAMQKYLYIKGSDLYIEELGDTSNSYLWPFSQAVAATVSVAHIQGEKNKLSSAMANQLDGLGQYLTTAPATATTSAESLQSLPHYAATISQAGPGGTSYYDDNDWVGIEMARLYELTGQEAALVLAEQILAFEEAGWDTNASAPCPGGIPHATNGPEAENRSTISTAPAAELALQLYHITHSAPYLQFAETAYNWVRQCLLTPSGLYADHLEADGEVDPEFWSYTQGVMIGAGALLYKETGNGGYLAQANATAATALSAFRLETLAAENPFFASVFLRNLMYLDSIVHSHAGITLAQEYVNWAWESLREPDGLFLSAEGGKTTLLGQSAVAQIYALLGTSPATYF